MHPTDAEIDRQLPHGEEIFLDHVAHFVPDADAAGAALARAGFMPTPRSVQVNPDPAGDAPRLTGTGNITAMFARGYVEVLFKTADTELSRQFDVALARHAGLHLAAFSVADAAAAHRRLGEAGFRMQPMVAMARPVDAETGPGTAAFTLARLAPGEMPEGRIQLLTHRTPALVWQPRWLSHPNGARALTRVLIAVTDPEEAAARFARFTGRPAAATTSGQSIKLDRGRIDLVSAAELGRTLPQLAIPSLPFIAGYGIKVESVPRVIESLRTARLTVLPGEQYVAVLFPPELGYGAWLFQE